MNTTTKTRRTSASKGQGGDVEPAKPSLVKQWGWFALIWAVSLVTVASVGYAIKFLMSLI